MKKGTLVVACSGGKDSTALALWIRYESGLDNEMVFVFCDTGHEHLFTYEQIDKLEKKLQTPIYRLKGKYNFFSLARKKKRFPSVMARFCTQELKIKPMKDFIDTIENPVVVVGIRAEESATRSLLPEWVNAEDSGVYGCPIWRPLIRWTAKEVFECHRRHNFPPNPLYLRGCSRVGCFPCIMARKADIKACIMLDDGIVERIGEWEKRIGSTFFADDTVPRKFRRSEPYLRDRKPHATIDAVAAWALGDSKYQMDLFGERSCMSYYGLCE